MSLCIGRPAAQRKRAAEQGGADGKEKEKEKEVWYHAGSVGGAGAQVWRAVRMRGSDPTTTHKDAPSPCFSFRHFLLMAPVKFMLTRALYSYFSISSPSLLHLFSTVQRFDRPPELADLRKEVAGYSLRRARDRLASARWVLLHTQFGHMRDDTA